MPGGGPIQRDQRLEHNFFADWVASEDHFGAPAITRTYVTQRPSRSQYLRQPALDNSNSNQAPVVPASQTQASNLPTSTDASTQTDQEAVSVRTLYIGEALPRSSPPPTPSATTATSHSGPPGLSASAASALASEAPLTPLISPVLETDRTASSPVEPATPPEAPAPPPAVRFASSHDSVNTVIEPVVAASSAAAQDPPSRRRSVPRACRSRSEVSRDSYTLLWREYIALTAEDQQRQRATSSPQRSWLPSTGSSRTSSISSSGRGTANMHAAAPNSTIMQGPLSFDKPKGLAMLLLAILCPPTDFIDMQKLTKLLIRITMSASYWVVTLSFIVIPAWLWLLRHELLQGHRGDAAAVLVLGLTTLLATDWACGAAARAENAHRVGVFTAGTISASQLLPARHTGSFAKGARPPSVFPASAAVGKHAEGSVGGSVPAPHTSSLPDNLSGGGRVVPSITARSSEPSVGMNGAVSSPGAMDALVRQVKQRIIKLERILFGNELTEADISPDALNSRVRMLCTEVGVPFGGPGGSSTRLSTSELDHQLRAVESALGVT